MVYICNSFGQIFGLSQFPSLMAKVWITCIFNLDFLFNEALELFIWVNVLNIWLDRICCVFNQHITIPILIIMRIDHLFIYFFFCSLGIKNDLIGGLHKKINCNLDLLCTTFTPIEYPHITS